MGKHERNRIHQRLTTSRDMVEASVFSAAKAHAVDCLDKPWIRYLKEDLKTFVELVALFVIDRCTLKDKGFSSMQ